MDDEPEWSLQDARSHFSALVNAARGGQPQRVTKRGKRAVVVLAVEEYERLRLHERADAKSFVEHLLAIPREHRSDRGEEASERIAVALREVDL